FQSAWLMLWRVDEKLKRLARWTGAVCISYFMFASIRILSNILDPSAIDFFKLNAIDSVILLAYQLLGILLTFTLILMINGRLLNEISAYAEEKNKMAAELNRLASTDTLTGINNRLKLDRVLNAEVLRSKRYLRPLSAILLDIDHFKSVNDT